MNNGKVCVSVCAKTAVQMAEQMRKAEEFADLIEIRLDCLSPSERLPATLELRSAKPLLFTYRPKSEGGYSDDDPAKRITFWRSLAGNASLEKAFVDLETDVLEKVDLPATDKIVSIHDFSGVPVNIESLFDAIGKNGDIVKIAVQANDLGDSVPVWNLIARARSQNKRVIPIAMGEAGKWTRILGLAHGAFLTYASLETGSETAPGQISAKDLIEVYRAKDLDESTKVFGIIGDPVSQSLSPYMHNPAFASRGINAVFIPFLVKDLDPFVTQLLRPETREVSLDLGGLSVTMPHKQAIMKYLDEIDETARAIGAVNTVKVDAGKLIGYNTDAHGFISPLKKMFGDLKGSRVALFGAGGAARACVFALRREGAELTVFVRDLQKTKAFAKELDVPTDLIGNVRLNDFDIVVDATPFGMKGDLEDKSLSMADELAGLRFVYDLVTKPYDTPIISEAKKANVPTLGGLEMLVAQGVEQFRIWTGEAVAPDEMKGYVLSRLSQ